GPVVGEKSPYHQQSDPSHQMSCCDAVVTGTCLTQHIPHVLDRNLHVAENRVRRTQEQSGIFDRNPIPCPQNPPRFTPRGGQLPLPTPALLGSACYGRYVVTPPSISGYV